MSRPISLELHLGAGTPVGELGVVATYAVAPAVALGLGLGTGSGPNSVNAHAGAYLQLKPFRGVHNALVGEAAFSTGPYTPFDPLAGLMGEGGSPIVREQAEWAHFAQFAVGWEYRTSGGLVFRFTSGVAFLMNPSSMHCTSEDPTTHVVTDCTSPRHGSDSFETFELSIGQSF